LPNDPRVHVIWAAAIVATFGTIAVASAAVAIHVISAFSAVVIALIAAVCSLVGLRVSVRLGAGAPSGALATVTASLLPVCFALPLTVELPRLQPDVELGVQDMHSREVEPRFVHANPTSYAIPELAKPRTPEHPGALPACIKEGEGYGYQFEPDQFGPRVSAPSSLSTFRPIRAALQRSFKVIDPCPPPVEDEHCESEIPLKKGERVGCTMVAGRLPPESVQRTIRLRLGAFSACFDPYLALVKGSVRLIVVPSGNILNLGITGEIEAPLSAKELVGKGLERALACMADRLQDLTFGAQDGGLITIVWPYQYGGYNEVLIEHETLRPDGGVRTDDERTHRTAR
jgi:hypothetical protein